MAAAMTAAAAVDDAAVDDAGTPTTRAGFLVVTNVSKKHNVRSLATAAAAFGVGTLIVGEHPNRFSLRFPRGTNRKQPTCWPVCCGAAVGQPHFDEETHLPPSLAVRGRLAIQRVADLTALRALLSSLGARLYGIEIVDGAQRFHEVSWAPRAAFMMGNEGSGMNEAQLAVCDEFLYIPQYGGGTASLNVANAAAIVLHHWMASTA